MFRVFTLNMQRHLIHLPVAGRAANAFIDVNAVIEIDEVREIVYPGPVDRFAGLPNYRESVA